MALEEIGLQFETRQEGVIAALRRYATQPGMALNEECPLRRDLEISRGQTNSDQPTPGARSSALLHSPSSALSLAAVFENYFQYYFRQKHRRGLLVGPTVGRWTAILYDEKAIDCQLLKWVSAEASCRGVGYCFIEDDEYSYIEMVAGRTVEIYSSILADSGGKSFWSVSNNPPPAPGRWIAEGFLKQRHQFMAGFYDLPYVHGRKQAFCCYRYDAFPDVYDETDNFPLSAFRYFDFQLAGDQEGRQV
ncbi:hypothetical protein FJY63_12005 [Candidatus Sumerlaeota bacterium]|nr:hypothetical protein [Candidatus Sumerlaeota bacterium]